MQSNPFVDLIPQNAAPQGMGNPFVDLIPATQPQSAQQQPTSTLNNFFTGLGRGVVDTGEGLKQWGLGGAESLGLVSPGTQSAYTKQTDAERAAYAQTPQGQSTAGGVGRFTGEVVPAIAATALTKNPGFVGNVLTGAALGNTQYVPEGGSRGFNTALGGGLGGAVDIAGKAISAGVGKVYNTIKGGTIDPAAQAVIDAGDKHQVPVNAADASNNSLFKTLDQGLEEVPILGTRGYRVSQNQAAKVAAQNVVEDLQQKMLSTEVGGPGGMQKLQAIANSNSPRANAAQKLIESIGNAGDDWQKITENSGNLQLFNNKLTADQKYNAVENLANQYGNVTTPNTATTLAAAIQQAKSSVLPDTGLLNTLTTVQNNLAKGNLNYSQLRQARSDIGGIISDAYKGSNAAVGTQGAAALQGIKEAIGRDMSTFAAQNGPELAKASKAADAYYQTAVAPYKDVQLAKALTNAAPDEIYGKFITAGGTEGGKGTSRAAKLYNALDSQGQAAVRYGMVNNAFNSAYDANKGTFSPAIFSGELDRIAAAKGVFFRGQDKAEIDGFKNLMTHVQRSNVAINKPETGVKNIPYLIGGLATGGALVAPWVTAASGAGLYGLKNLMTTNAGRNFLLSSSKLKVGSPAMQKAIDNFARTSQTTGIKGVLEGLNSGRSQQ